MGQHSSIATSSTTVCCNHLFLFLLESSWLVLRLHISNVASQWSISETCHFGLTHVFVSQCVSVGQGGNVQITRQMIGRILLQICHVAVMFGEHFPRESHILVLRLNAIVFVKIGCSVSF